MPHLLIRSAADQVDWWFTTYAVRVEGLSDEMDNLVTYLIVEYDDETSIAEDESVTHQKGLYATITFILGVRGDKIITIT